MKIYTSCNYIVEEQTHNGLSAVSWVMFEPGATVDG